MNPFTLARLLCFFHSGSKDSESGKSDALFFLPTGRSLFSYQPQESAELGS